MGDLNAVMMESRRGTPLLAQGIDSGGAPVVAEGGGSITNHQNETVLYLAAASILLSGEYI